MKLVIAFILPRQQIIVDATQKNASFKVEPIAFSPNDDGVKDLIYLNVNAPNQTHSSPIHFLYLQVQRPQEVRRLYEAGKGKPISSRNMFGMVLDRCGIESARWVL